MNLLNENAWRQQVQAGLGDLAHNTRLLQWSQSTSLAYIRRAYDRSRRQGAVEAWRSVLAAAQQMGGTVRVVVSETQHLLNTTEVQTTTLYDVDRHDSWAIRLVDTGHVVLVLELSAPGVLHNLAEVLIDRLGVRHAYTTIMEDVLLWARQRQERLELEAKRVEGQIEAVYSEPDGSYTLWLLQDRQSYIREGLVMHHCTGDYDVTPERRLYSVRDATGRSHATVEWKAAKTALFVREPERISQALGFANQPMAPDVAEFVERWRVTIGLPSPAKPAATRVAVDDAAEPRGAWLGTAGIDNRPALRFGNHVMRITPEQRQRLLEQQNRISAGYTEPDPRDVFSIVTFDKEESAPAKLLMLKPRPTGTMELHYDPNTPIFQAREAEEENGGAASVGRGVGTDAGTPQCSVGARCSGEGCADNATDDKTPPSLGLGAIRGH